MLSKLRSAPIWAQLRFYRELCAKFKEDSRIPSNTNDLLDGVLLFEQHVRRIRKEIPLNDKIGRASCRERV